MMRLALAMAALLIQPIAPATEDDPARPSPSPKPAATEAAAEPAKRAGAKPFNVRIEVTVGEHRGSGPPTTKTTTVTVADGEVAVVRALTVQPKALHFNLDARPRIDPSGKIRIHLTVEYEGPHDKGASEPPLHVRQQVTTLMESGRVMRVAEAADPATDRRIAVDVTATILR